MTQPYRNLADYIITRTRQLGHNTTSLSQALGFGRSYINSIVNGQFVPSQKRCWKIAEHFGDDPNIILGLAGYYEPPKGDPIITHLTQITNSLPRRLQRDLLNYAGYLKTRSPLAAVRERVIVYGGNAIYLELPGGECLEIEVDPKIAMLPPDKIKHIIVTALEATLE